MTTPETGKQGKRFVWGMLSIAIPILAVLIGFLIVADASRGVGGDMVGPAYFVYAELGVGIAGIFGAAAALRSILKREDCLTLASVSLLLNFAFIVLGVLAGKMLLR
jgi:hypothetical protein